MTVLTRSLLAAVVGGALTATASASDFGDLTQRLLNATASKFFGVKEPLESASAENLPREGGQTAADLLDIAGGLRAQIFSREVANNADQMAFWPSPQAATHLVYCVEVFTPATLGTFENGTTKFTPSVQSIDLETREVKTILRGMAGCDGIARTPWGTILATEEDGGLDTPLDGASGTATGIDNHLGNAYEILDPLAVENITIRRGLARGTAFDETGAEGDIADADGHFGVALRQALPEMAWEGIVATPEGVVIAGDELRPGEATTGDFATIGGTDTDGGAIFKFVPAAPRYPSQGPITALEQSPLVLGDVFAMRINCTSNSDVASRLFGQGCEKGLAEWVKVGPLTARVDADRFGAVGFYRPEDMDLDPNSEALRFCWTNTGNRSALNFGEVLCAVDSDPLHFGLLTTDPSYPETQVTLSQSVSVEVFLEGDADLNQPDNIAFQAQTGNTYVIEDSSNGDVFACLPDGEDRDEQTDGCVRILTLKDASAEPTGFIFDAAGNRAYVFVQHSNDDLVPALDRDGFQTDDLIVIRGFGRFGNSGNPGWWWQN
jgi:hypothetical protein